MDDISFIAVNGDLFGRDNQHQYWHHTYYRDRNTTAYDEGGEDVYSEGTGGRINFYVSGKKIKGPDYGNAEVPEYEYYDEDVLLTY